MPAARKPHVDWNAVRLDCVGGKGPRELARKYGVAHTTIMERRDKEGWLDQPVGAADQQPENAPTSLPTAYQRFYQPAIELPEDTRGKKTPARVEAICQEIVGGASEATASILNDIDPKTLTRWKQDDPEVLSAVVRAFAMQGRRDETCVDNAVKRGSENTALKRLGKNPVTKEHWADNQSSGAVFNFNLKIPLPGTVNTIEPVTIDNEAA